MPRVPRMRAVVVTVLLRLSFQKSFCEFTWSEITEMLHTYYIQTFAFKAESFPDFYPAFYLYVIIH